MFVSLTIAILLSQSKFIEHTILPYAVFIQVTAIVTIAPFIIIWVSDIFYVLVILAWVSSVFPIISNTLLGLKSINNNLSDLFVIYNSLNFNKQNKLYKKLNMVKQIESPPLLKIIFIGRLTKNKRLDILLEAIKKTELMIKLIIIGDGEEKESLIELVRKYSVQNIHFLMSCFTI